MRQAQMWFIPQPAASAEVARKVHYSLRPKEPNDVHEVIITIGLNCACGVPYSAQRLDGDGWPNPAAGESVRARACERISVPSVSFAEAGWVVPILNLVVYLFRG